MVLSKDGEGITDPYSAMAYLPNNHTNRNMHTPTYKTSKYRGTPKLTTKIPLCVCVRPHQEKHEVLPCAALFEKKI